MGNPQKGVSCTGRVACLSVCPARAARLELTYFPLHSALPFFERVRIRLQIPGFGRAVRHEQASIGSSYCLSTCNSHGKCSSQYCAGTIVVFRFQGKKDFSLAEEKESLQDRKCTVEQNCKSQCTRLWLP